MPTLVTKTLKKDGSGDYTTISSFVAAEAADLVATDTVLRLEIYKSGWDKATPLTENFIEFGNNFTTDSTRYVELYVADSDRHTFTENTGFVMSLGASFGFVVRNEYIVVDGIEFYNCTSSNALWYQASNAQFKNCMLYDITADNCGLFYAENCIAYNYAQTSQAASAMAYNSTSLNCTFIIKNGHGSLQKC